MASSRHVRVNPHAHAVLQASSRTETARSSARFAITLVLRVGSTRPAAALTLVPACRAHAARPNLKVQAHRARRAQWGASLPRQACRYVNPAMGSTAGKMAPARQSVLQSPSALLRNLRRYRRPRHLTAFACRTRHALATSTRSRLLRRHRTRYAAQHVYALPTSLRCASLVRTTTASAARIVAVTHSMNSRARRQAHTTIASARHSLAVERASGKRQRPPRQVIVCAAKGRCAGSAIMSMRLWDSGRTARAALALLAASRTAQVTTAALFAA